MDIINPLPRPGGKRDDSICYINFTQEKLMEMINNISTKLKKQIDKESIDYETKY